MKKIVSVNTDYEIYLDGTVKRIKDGFIPKPYLRQGYYRVSLYDSVKKKMKAYTLHRIIAQAFIPNPENKQQVNHKNGIKYDNNINNLEWTTPKENVIHSIANNLKSKYKMYEYHKEILKEVNCKKVIDESTGIIYESISIAAKKLGYRTSTLTHYLLGSRTNKTSLRYY